MGLRLSVLVGYTKAGAHSTRVGRDGVKVKTG
jgi:hypothetical protein